MVALVPPGPTSPAYILASPDELRVKIAVTPFVSHLDGAAVILFQHGLILRRGDVLAGRLVVFEGFDLLGFSEISVPYILPAPVEYSGCDALKNLSTEVFVSVERRDHVPTDIRESGKVHSGNLGLIFKNEDRLEPEFSPVEVR